MIPNMEFAFFKNSSHILDILDCGWAFMVIY